MSIENALERVGLRPPPAIVTAFAYRSTASAAVNAMPATADLATGITSGTTTPRKLVNAIGEAALARAVRVEAVAIYRELERAFSNVENAAVRAAGDDVIALLRPIAADALEQLAGAVRVLGPVPDARAAGVGGVAMVEAFGAFTAATKRLQAVSLCVHELHVARYLLVPGADAITWLSSGTTGAEITRARRLANESIGDRLANLVAAGFALELNTAEGQRILLDAHGEHERAVATSTPRKRPSARNLAEVDAWASLVKPKA